MLTQLVEKHELGAQVVPHEAVSRMNIGSLDVKGVAMICISYLDISGNPAHLRFRLRRLRQHQPKASLLVGLWPEQDPILKDQELGRMVGSDYYVGTLREAVETCIAAAHQAARPKPRLVISADEVRLS